MHRLVLFRKTLLLTTLSLIFVTNALAQSGGPPSAQPRRARLVRAFIIDDRLSALRREPDMQSEVMQRLRLGRPVYLIKSKGGKDYRPPFYRVAVTRRTRGWIHEAALAMPERAGEDVRIMKLIEGARDGLDRIALCRFFIEHFKRSPLAPRALLAIAEESDRAATALTRRARTRLANLKDNDNGVGLRDYYLSDVGLDRYSRLGIKFDFNEASAQYVYNGDAYRELIKRFPNADEAARARKRMEQKIAQR